ncbi:hypothetical protein MNEG_9985 [Monoraphidium neglectum]|uniref:Uncharacterized protein n=1 Tax=Monoraphidium neglectum TaxID=145388 RepID=A0A0D2MU61_9CHLO|nr:hypothetical protein MNEG_9985 [Monoraphidium neglectum]KIY97975.1 hypothetical protein MNEG_9985 [Monoraphidium neglectum]|eukprot:XP_013896995.1 hypothetical protein MNEG_9985 [Monoraphidium neglectum]
MALAAGPPVQRRAGEPQPARPATTPPAWQQQLQPQQQQLRVPRQHGPPAWTAGANGPAEVLCVEAALDMFDSGSGLRRLAAALPPALFVHLLGEHDALERARRRAAAADAAVAAVEGVLAAKRSEAAAAHAAAASAGRRLHSALRQLEPLGSACGGGAAGGAGRAEGATGPVACALRLTGAGRGAA